MKEHPILFSGAMVRAILAGNKTQTRRVIHLGTFHGPQAIRHGRGDLWIVDFGPTQHDMRCPYGKSGDRLWVRETHCIVPATAYRASREDDGSQVPHRVSPNGDEWAVYREGWTRCDPGRWRPSIHMPRWASRIALEIVDVRVQRVQEISLHDIEAEGTPYNPVGNLSTHNDGYQRTHDFMWLWDSINDKRGFGWAVNPWVWAITFKREVQS